MVAAANPHHLGQRVASGGGPPARQTHGRNGGSRERAGGQRWRRRRDGGEDGHEHAMRAARRGPTRVVSVGGEGGATPTDLRVASASLLR